MKEPNNKKLRNSILAGSAASGIATGASLGVSSHNTQQTPVLSEQDIDNLIPTDVPINEMTIYGMHNAGTEPGSGTAYVSSNQSMSIEEALNETPVRAFSLDVRMHDGEIVVNHGGVFDPSVDQPTTLQETLDTLNEWRLENPDEVITLSIQYDFGTPGNRTAEDYQHIAEVSQMLEDQFGESIWTPQEQIEFFDANDRWPTIDEMTAGGNQVIIGSRFGNEYSNQFSTIEGQSTYHEWIKGIGEDRNTYAHPIDGIYKHMPDNINADDIEGHNGVVWLDKITPDDPRFIDHADIMRPDTSVHNIFYTNNGLQNNIAFGMGTGAAAGAGTLSAASGVFMAYQMKDFLKSVENGTYARSFIKNLDYSELNKKYDQEVQPEDIKKKITSNVKRSLTKNVLTSGGFSTIGLSSSIMAMGLLMPPLLPAFSIAAIATAGVGTLATAAATIYARRKADKAVNKAFSRNDINELVGQRAKELEASGNSTKQTTDKTQDDGIFTSNNPKKFEKTLETVGTVLIGTMLLTRITSMAKYSMPAIGMIAGSVTAGLVTLSSLYSGFNNYHRRKKLFKDDTTRGTRQYILSEIDKKPYLGMFGKSEFYKYISEHKDELNAELGTKETKPSKIIDELHKEGNEGTLYKHRENSLKDSYYKDFTKHKKQNPDANFNEFIINKVEKDVQKDVRRSGIWNTAKITISIFSTSIFFPPISGILTAAAVATMAIGTATSLVVAKKEKKNISERVRTAINDAEVTHGENPSQDSLRNLLHKIHDHHKQKHSSNNVPVIPAQEQTKFTSKIQKLASAKPKSHVESLDGQRANYATIAR